MRSPRREGPAGTEGEYPDRQTWLSAVECSVKACRAPEVAIPVDANFREIHTSNHFCAVGERGQRDRVNHELGGALIRAGPLQQLHIYHLKADPRQACRLPDPQILRAGSNQQRSSPGWALHRPVVWSTSRAAATKSTRMAAASRCARNILLLDCSL